ncbi:MAG: TetR family transcriptional regulator [Lutibacter sp.]|nr:MAG: TetR family transcriptional regulator [Lutibacter sp.]
MREKILHKSADMFLSYGFKSVTMDDIANEIGISKKTIYKYFSNKMELVDASTIVVQQTIDIAIIQIQERNLNAIEENFAIKTVFKNMFKKAKTSPMFQLKKYYPKTYAKLMEAEICSFSDCVMNNLVKGIKNKLYRSKIDKEMVMKFYFTLVFGAYENDLFSLEMKDILKTELEILEYHTRAISTNYGVEILEQELINYKNNQL